MKQRIVTTDAPAAIGPYSQAIQAGSFIFVSGQLPLNPKTGELIDEVGSATDQVIDNLEAILKAAGLTLEHVVRTDVFLRSMNDFQKMNEAYAKRFHSAAPPARQTIEARLPKNACVEISCIAVK